MRKLTSETSTSTRSRGLFDHICLTRIAKCDPDSRTAITTDIIRDHPHPSQVGRHSAAAYDLSS